ncbi:MAG: putative oxidoreductase [Chloroflexi bacterium OLB14]|nr:MAG: putative oxidoreductase [Chloroflexi bacterium OLB14]
MDLKLKNKIALVTGASTGLGYAAALGLAKEGCKVVINGRNEKTLNAAVEKIQNETGSQVIGVIGDVSLPDVPEKIIQQTVQAFGGLDILITNTGGSAHGSIDVLNEEEWQKGIDLYLMSHVRLIKFAFPYLRTSDSASVLTITSIAAKQPIPSLLLSNSIRAGTLGLTKSLALDHGKDGIRFNSIIPSWTITERVAELLSARATANNSTLEEEAKKQASESVFGRMASTEEFANVAVFLVSPAASYVTGVMLSVDGGSYKATI